MKMSPQKLKSKKLIFCWHLESHWRKKQDPDPEPDVTQWYGSPDPYQNVTDPQNRDTVMCFKPEIVPRTVIARGFFGRNKTNCWKKIMLYTNVFGHVRGPGRVHWAWSFLEAEFLSDIVIWDCARHSSGPAQRSNVGPSRPSHVRFYRMYLTVDFMCISNHK